MGTTSAGLGDLPGGGIEILVPDSSETLVTMSSSGCSWCACSFAVNTGHWSTKKASRGSPNCYIYSSLSPSLLSLPSDHLALEAQRDEPTAIVLIPIRPLPCPLVGNFSLLELEPLDAQSLQRRES